MNIAAYQGVCPTCHHDHSAPDTALASGSGDHAELARLAEAATPGPWEWWSSCSHWRLTGADRRDGGVISATKASDGFPLVVCNEDDRAFIAAARSAVPALIAEVAALREDRDQWRNWYRKASVEINAQDDRATEAERKLAEAVGHMSWMRVFVPTVWDVTEERLSEIDAFLSKEAERG